MTGGFTFPPPPPPPPKVDQPLGGQQGYQPSTYQHNARGRGRGRGGPRDSSGQRGRGQSGRGGHTSPFYSQAQPGQHQSGAPSSHGQYHSHQTVGYQSRGQRGSQHNVSTSRIAVNPESSSHRTGDGSISNYPQGGAGYGAPQAPSGGSPQRTVAGHKRKLEALRGPQDGRTRKPAPQTAPAVPSFGHPIVPSALSPPNTALEDSQTNGTKPKSVARSLGLTPSGEATQNTYSDSEDEKDVDEEAMYAELGDKLTFEHNGVVMSLKSQADLGAWKKERQKKWPTQARMAERAVERRRVGEERKRLPAGSGNLQDSKQRRTAKPNSNRATGEKAKPTNQTSGANSTPVAQKPVGVDQGSKGTLEKTKEELALQERRLSELRRRVAESEARNREAKAQKEREADRDAAASAGPHEETQDQNVLAETAFDINVGPQPQDGEEDAEHVEDIPGASALGVFSELSEDSSSGSDSDDSAPEEVTSKPTTSARPDTQRPLCKYFAASGYCRDGDACRFRHEPPQRTDAGGQSQRTEQTRHTPKPPPIQLATEKKSIFQRLVEQEEKAEDRLALQVIKHLGKAGFFRESTPAEEQ
ncbi:hypothetical protein LTR37_019962 [Vermiconidia calcicola]|uniref:Uncharacterized protein n=1 Tax=Vermiconidia calcicola TaxID=1690605 RepID=A0ACC3MFM7_9PEZI|nr:hypothetical protein LTR37_019962 [Vermiconidia calcicola]